MIFDCTRSAGCGVSEVIISEKRQWRFIAAVANYSLSRQTIKTAWLSKRWGYNNNNSARTAADIANIATGDDWLCFHATRRIERNFWSRNIVEQVKSVNSYSHYSMYDRSTILNDPEYKYLFKPVSSADNPKHTTYNECTVTCRKIILAIANRWRPHRYTLSKHYVRRTNKHQCDYGSMRSARERDRIRRWYGAWVRRHAAEGGAAAGATRRAPHRKCSAETRPWPCCGSCQGWRCWARSDNARRRAAGRARTAPRSGQEHLPSARRQCDRYYDGPQC